MGVDAAMVPAASIYGWRMRKYSLGDSLFSTTKCIISKGINADFWDLMVLVCGPPSARTFIILIVAAAKSTALWCATVHMLTLPVSRGSISAKVGFWVGLRFFSYVPTPTKLTNAISKTQLSDPKKGVFLPNYPESAPFFVFGVF